MPIIYAARCMCRASVPIPLIHNSKNFILCDFTIPFPL